MEIKQGKKVSSTTQEPFTSYYQGITISQVDTPRGEDINSLLQGHTPEIFTNLVDNRTPLFLLPEQVLPEETSIKNENDTIPGARAERTVHRGTGRVQTFRLQVKEKKPGACTW